MSTVRLHIDTDLTPGIEITVERNQAHYLFNVMRVGVGESLLIFNGRDGEWRAEIIETGKRRGTLRATEQTRPQDQPPDIELLFAPIKKARTDFIVEKACELGCRTVRPILTDYTNAERINLPRLYAHMIEAAEQCGGLTVPTLEKPERLSSVLSGWEDRLLIFCDEARTAPCIDQVLTGVARQTPVSILIGPEGGFSPSEAARIHSVPTARAVSLGPRVLRADTAVVSAISMVQASLGDWH